MGLPVADGRCPAVRRSQEQAGDGNEAPVNGIGSEAELLQGDGAQQRLRPWRTLEEDGHPFFALELERHLSDAVDDALAIGQCRRPLVRRRQSELGDDFGGQQSVRRSGVDKKIENYGPFPMLGMGQGDGDRERAHGRTLSRARAGW